MAASPQSPLRLDQTYVEANEDQQQGAHFGQILPSDQHLPFGPNRQVSWRVRQVIPEGVGWSSGERWYLIFRARCSW
jgi:hypothetical protein